MVDQLIALIPCNAQLMLHFLQDVGVGLNVHSESDLEGGRDVGGKGRLSLLRH
jgi:hypothetical protein